MVYVVEFGVELFVYFVIFFKYLNIVVGLNDVVLLLFGVEKVDWEVEFVVVIGKMV